MAKNRPPSYTPAPEPPTDPDLRRRYDAIMAVIAQTQTVTAAAESLGMSRNHFQTILHRVTGALTPFLSVAADRWYSRADDGCARVLEETRDRVAGEWRNRAAVQHTARAVGEYARMVGVAAEA